jgi:hypothetical protein
VGKTFNEIVKQRKNSRKNLKGNLLFKSWLVDLQENLNSGNPSESDLKNLIRTVATYKNIEN